MAQKTKQWGAIIIMIALFAMIAFVTNLCTPMATIIKNQGPISNVLAQIGNYGNFIAYLVMGIPAGMLISKYGYKKTALIGLVVGSVGILIQWISGLMDVDNNLDGGILVGMEIVEPNEYVLVITEKGYGKKTPVDEYRITNRGGKGVKTVNITEKNGSIVSFKTVDDSKDLMIITDSGIIIRLAVDKISTMSRVTQGVKLINLKEDSIVSSTSIVDREEVSDDNINGENIEKESE